MTEILLGIGFISVLLVVLAALVHTVRDYLLPSRPVAVTVNGKREIAALANFKLLDILNANGVAVPSGCAGAGTCGLCRVSGVSGTGDPLPTERARLSPADVRAGTRLACQIVVRNDVAVTVPDEVLGITTMQCRVASSRSVTPLIKEIVLALPEGAQFDFRAGNFVQVTAPAYRLDFSDIALEPQHAAEWKKLGIDKLSSQSSQSVSRAYSVASRPRDAGLIVLNIRLATPPPAKPQASPGIVSSWLFGLREGDAVEVAGPYGHFGAQDSEREMVFIGGGVGMAPLRAIITDMLERQGSRRKISFWYGARSRGELFYAEEFDELARRYQNFRWVPALSEPARNDAWEGETGFVHDVVFKAYLKDHSAPEDCEYYLCGPPLMIEAVYAMLDECGVERESIFNDDFGI
ncbi:NADH:ubiquinone reductase (Na(+)-transporting) subunit F [Agrobacterium tumefaciens]|jgi:Na+-transporting NADH:ubiquinone oxidoreductase subunit F|uniref:Na(+)-translocating NADH-quinone reductase subunit F n=1 Tax=Brucella anthropi TaxID=529 RepID=A0A6I0CS25_BRUAN|nr:MULTISPECIES: NADH:ubiquinone reductase (Na(+)-transporting) subunit F [Hyphomicrobiales]MDX3928139.1 NADH:ubiquinone reductase (Na(+)-transporting) subunit F [Shinella sp.]WKL22114.1 NADH:ubiquinone reductase (Na(+)-transporting) subunit F [Agrobacterium tumefaciens]HBT70527.1 NADH:ubiquinone reductase (Na(+)-transporting) subunit F [Agrobacterium sp.]KAB2758316.1 NADH:ubiquinone reductase (Na(+)-transporting) subunit F [Brucella anthropi]KAB2764501.1 NADH:ubiquinone reductase (Na(+)-trans